jgi:16S rRNA G966 N2-methylase RsmD
VEIEKKRAFDIKKKASKISKSFKVYSVDALKFLKNSKEKFDIVFADPPYNFKNYEVLIEEGKKHTNEGGVFILEHRSNMRFNPDKEKKYGDTILSFWYI